MRIKIVLAYDGQGYHGWQLQKNSSTVQGSVEEALQKICSSPVRVYGAGRTDAGVHALGQVAHFDSPPGKEHIPWQKALNAVLPEAVRITRASAVDDGFHARFSAIYKTYAYTFWTEPEYILPQRRRYAWKTGPLDLEAMIMASKTLIGAKDFMAFMNSGSKVKSTWREVIKVSFDPAPCLHELVFRITADGFLKQMVRNIVGALVTVGRNRYAWDHLEKLLAGKNRSFAPATAPALGLCLEEVGYPDQYGPN